jgi:hypothetical protein
MRIAVASSMTVKPDLPPEKEVRLITVAKGLSTGKSWPARARRLYRAAAAKAARAAGSCGGLPVLINI